MLSPIGNISAYVSALGKAYVYVASDPTNAASWALLGLTEGEVQADEKFMFNDLKLPEWTGDAVHERMIDGQDIVITIPLIWGDATLYDKIAPSGSKGGGRSRPQSVTTKTVLIIPTKEVSTGLSYDGATWTPTAPNHAIWLHKASFEPGSYAFKHGDGGKVIRQVGVHPLFDDTKPEGQKLYTIGNPAAQGITTYRV
jgi:hypothetical protein